MNTTGLIYTLGYIGMFAILFAETGLMVGCFLPGDTLLLSAHILADRGHLQLPLQVNLPLPALLALGQHPWLRRAQGRFRAVQRADVPE